MFQRRQRHHLMKVVPPGGEILLLSLVVKSRPSVLRWCITNSRTKQPGVDPVKCHRVDVPTSHQEIYRRSLPVPVRDRHRRKGQIWRRTTAAVVLLYGPARTIPRSGGSPRVPDPDNCRSPAKSRGENQQLPGFPTEYRPQHLKVVPVVVVVVVGPRVDPSLRM